MQLILLTLQESGNYGAFWQAYALKTHLESEGHSVTLPAVMPRSIHRPGWRRFLGRSVRDTVTKCVNAYKRRFFDDFWAQHLYGGRGRPVTAAGSVRSSSHARVSGRALCPSVQRKRGARIRKCLFSQSARLLIAGACHSVLGAWIVAAFLS